MMWRKLAGVNKYEYYKRPTDKAHVRNRLIAYSSAVFDWRVAFIYEEGKIDDYKRVPNNVDYEV